MLAPLMHRLSAPTFADHRRMSEPAPYCSESYSSPSIASAPRSPHYQLAYNASTQTSSSYPPYPLHRGHTVSSLRDLHHHRQAVYSPPQHHPGSNVYNTGSGHLEEPPIATLHPDFTGAASMEIGLRYSPLGDDHYGSSPPGTGTSDSSVPQNHDVRDTRSSKIGGAGANGIANSRKGPHYLDNGKTYSFVSLPGNAVKKRPRRRYDEIERLYHCSWPECTKAYGTLNHLNAHVTMQKHGSKRSPNEFKELRKQWRKAKKEEQDNRCGARRVVLRQIDHGMHPYDQPLLAHHAAHMGLHPPISVDARYTQSSSAQLGMPTDGELHLRRQEREEREYMRRASFTSPSTTSSSVSWQPTTTLSRSLPNSTFMGSAGAQMNSLPPEARSNHVASTPNVIRRLPADSTLLTPLPGYESPSLLPPPPQQVEVGMGGYDGYQSYDRIYTDEGRRADNGHGSMGAHSTESDYDL